MRAPRAAGSSRLALAPPRNHEMALANAIRVAVRSGELHWREALRLLARVALRLTCVALGNARFSKAHVPVLDKRLHHKPLRAVAPDVCGDVAEVVVDARHLECFRSRLVWS